MREVINSFIELGDKTIEQEEEIKRLKEEYMILQNASDEVEEEKDKEMERLNNIINELEKYLQENINNIYAYFDNTPFGVEETYKEVLSKLQELKGIDKE